MYMIYLLSSLQLATVAAGTTPKESVCAKWHYFSNTTVINKRLLINRVHQ